MTGPRGRLYHSLPKTIFFCADRLLSLNNRKKTPQDTYSMLLLRKNTTDLHFEGIGCALEGVALQPKGKNRPRFRVKPANSLPNFCFFRRSLRIFIIGKIDTFFRQFFY